MDESAYRTVTPEQLNKDEINNEQILQTKSLKRSSLPRGISSIKIKIVFPG